MRYFHVSYTLKIGRKAYPEYRLFERKDDTPFTIVDFVDNLLEEIKVNMPISVGSAELVSQLEENKKIIFGESFGEKKEKVELKKLKIKEVFERDFLVLCPITSHKKNPDGTFSEVTKEEYEKYMTKHLFVHRELSPIAKEMMTNSVTLCCVRCDTVTMVTPESINSKIQLDPPAQAGDWEDVYACPKCPDANENRPGYKFTPIGDAYEQKRLQTHHRLEKP